MRSLYKLVSKVLISSLVGVMDDLNYPIQPPFLKDKFLVDRMVIVNEMVDLAKKTKKKPYIDFKLDFEKTYDLVS